MDNIHNVMYAGFKTAHFDKNIISKNRYRTEFITNNNTLGKKVLSSIEDELLNCDEFYISVAFITMSGITPLLQTLKVLEERNVKGKILTTDYLSFSDPRALDKLAMFKNIELKIYNSKELGFHTKGYIFKKDDIYRIIVGSANMTQKALTANNEWNTKIVSLKAGEYATDVLHDYDILWNHHNCFDYDEYIDEYRKQYNKNREIKKQLVYEPDYRDRNQFVPNLMQQEFISNLQAMYDEGKKRALLLSATGTGKTYASAFALKQLQAKKVLFLVHREQIAKQAIKSYKKIFGNTVSFGLLSGNNKDFDCDYLFATMQMMSKKNIYEKFNKDSFDFIIIDEVHRAGSSSYQTIMNYFTPRFYLGMTASPERTDGYDIFKVFDYNIAYEIRLQQAMEQDMLCPFHYFGISDLNIEGYTSDDKSELENFSYLVSEQRVNHIIEQSLYFGYSGDRIKGLVFCSNIKEANSLSDAFNKKGYTTTFLSGKSTQLERDEAIERLTSNNRIDKLDYIFTVDIFNEGVDIPEVNQVIMLRPTKSPIVFIQQLGRGLRNFEDKEYVVILDFIGNYNNNFMIPISLSGDKSYNKDNLRRYLMEGERVIPGVSTIHFDEISKKRIYESINKISGINKIINTSYISLKNKLGKIPSLLDFYEYGEIDPLLIIKQHKSYYSYLLKNEKEYTTKLTETESRLIEYMSSNIAKGTRIFEVAIIELLLQSITVDYNAVKEYILKNYNRTISHDEYSSSINVLQGKFVQNTLKEEYFQHISILENYDNKGYILNKWFMQSMNNSGFKLRINEIIALAKKRYLDKYHDTTNEVFKYGEKYTRKDVCYLLNANKDIASIMYGKWKIDQSVSLFVTYNKVLGIDNEYIDGKPDYGDEFIDNTTFIWVTQMGNGIQSTYTKDVLESTNRHLFVKKSDDEGAEFYYLGKCNIQSVASAKKNDKKGNAKDIAKIEFLMDKPVRNDIYQYLMD